MDYKKAFIKNLKEYRKKNNLTQDDLADMLGYSQKNIAKWEQGYSIPSVDVVIELSKKMNVSLDDLFGLKEKSLLEQCVDYILEKQNLDGNKIVEICIDKTMGIYETLGTERELVEDSVNRFAKQLVYCFNENNQKFKKDLFERLYAVNGKKRDKLFVNDELFLEFFKLNGNIIDNEDEWFVSDALMIECFETTETSLLKYIETETEQIMQDGLVETLKNELKQIIEIKEKYLSEK